MSLIKREPSPAQSSASRANSLLSTGPRSERGKSDLEPQSAESASPFPKS